MSFTDPDSPRSRAIDRDSLFVLAFGLWEDDEEEG